MKTWVGTSGFQYSEWKGRFYPEKLSKAKMLGFYSSVFNSTESNYTFRSIPSAETIARWVAETPEEFRFSLKAPQRVTHFSKLKECREVMKAFNSSIKGLGGKMGPILFQLPATFKADEKLLREFLKSMPKRLKMAFEFRHDSWLTEKTYSILADKNVALCWADSEEFSVPKVVTADFGYLRLRRKNYTKSALKKSADDVRKRSDEWKEAFVFFKHEETGTGPKFARRFSEVLESI